MLLTMGKEPFNHNSYIFEPKWDGWRLLLHKEGSRIEAFTRKGNLDTDKLPELQEIIGSIQAHSAIIDCEGVCIRDGRPYFDDFAHRGRLKDATKIQQACRTHPASFVAFDLLYLNGNDLTSLPLIERKQLLTRSYTLRRLSHQPCLYRMKAFL